MSSLPRRLWLPVVLACALGISGCAGQEPAAPTAAETSVGTPATVEPSTSQSTTPAGSPVPTTGEEPAVALEQAFASPDGALSFRYPAGWTVSVPADTLEEVRQWVLRDAEGEQVLSLTVRPDTDMYKVSPPLTPLVIPQGQIPAVVDGLGTPTLAAVAASPGHSAGAGGAVLYGMTSATGADPVFGDIRWGDGHLLSFNGHQMLGPNDQVDMAAAADQFAASPRFRTQILPVLQSLTATSGGPNTGGDPVAPGTSPEVDTGAPEQAPSAACVGEQYTYQNLQGLTCQQAKAILQEVSDTGEPIGARGQRTEQYHCFWSSVGEVQAGAADVLCRDRTDNSDLFDANYR